MRLSCLASLTLIAATASAQQLEWEPVVPPGRSYAGVCFDPVRGVAVMLGGTSAAGAAGDLWEWNGQQWLQRFDTGAPLQAQTPRLVFDSARSRVVAMNGSGTWAWTGGNWTSLGFGGPFPQLGGVAYDAARDRVVHFGGLDDIPRSATHLFNGSTWSAVQLSTVPPARYHQAMAYDPVRQVVVMHGGTAYDNSLGYYAARDTWEWDGTAWTQRSTAGPSGVSSDMAYDPARQAMIMVMTTGTDSQTWSWNGSTWQSLPSNLPPETNGIRLFFDENRGQMMAFGGGVSTDYYVSSTRALTSDGWVIVAGAPTPRTFAPLGFDEHRGVALMIGGRNQDGSIINELGVWEWDGLTWQLRNVPGGPGPETSGQWAYDPTRQKALWIEFTNPVKVWSYDGVAWAQLASAGAPSPDIEGYGTPGADFDRVRNKIVFALPSGFTANRINVWEWDSAGWTRLQPSAAPPQAQFARLVFDQNRGVTMMFNDFFTTLAWEWNGTAWTQRPHSATPPGDYFYSLAYHARLGNIVRFGGISTSFPGGVTNDIWRWTGTNWAPISVTTRPLTRESAGMTYDTVRNKVLMFGGVGGLGPIANDVLSDFWQLGDPCLTPQISSQPTDLAVCSGSPATFSLTATFGGATASYAWYRGTTRLNAFTNPSAASPTLTLASATAADAGVYTCVIRTPCGTITSPPRTLSISGPCCDSIDFNRNAVFPEEQDVIDFFIVYAGGPCPYAPPCDIDFNNDGIFPEDQDVVDFFHVLAGGTC